MELWAGRIQDAQETPKWGGGAMAGQTGLSLRRGVPLGTQVWELLTCMQNRTKHTAGEIPTQGSAWKEKPASSMHLEHSGYKYMDMDMIWNQKGHQEGKAWRRGLVETKTPELPGSPVKKTSKRGDQLYQMLPLRKQGKGYKRQDLTRITKLLALPRAAMTVQLLLFVRV